ncbi:MAG: DUF4230 domain-containing protein [Roseiflexaceae bacterium]|jgi:hypothetical protein
MMNFLKNVVWVVVVLAVGIFILRMPAAAELRQLVLAEPAVVAPTSVPTPTLVPATSTVVPTGTATTIPTATKTPMPTMTPTATRYVVQVSAVKESIIRKNELTVYEVIQRVTVNYEIEAQKWNFIDGAQAYTYQATYAVEAQFNLDLMDVDVSPSNKITVKMPPPTLDTPELNLESVQDKYYPDRGPYLEKSYEAEWAKTARKQAQIEASRQACQDGLLDNAAKEIVYVIKDMILNIDPRINTRDITVIVPAGTCEK